jgi:hypothetical protein
MDFDMISATGAPGWVELRLSGTDETRVLVKLENRDGRTSVTRVVLAGTLDSTTLRSLPLARVEAALSHPKFGMLRPPPAYPEDVLAEMSARGELFPEVTEMDAALESYLNRSKPSLRRQGRPRRTSTRKSLTRPDGTDPEGFSRRVAEAYNDALLTTSAPAPVLAAEAHVPVTTVHRWIREARQRGLLAPARKGRAG